MSQYGTGGESYTPLDIKITVDAFVKAIRMINKSSETDDVLASERIGIPIPDKQRLVFEQQFIDKCFDILKLFFGNRKFYMKIDEINEKIENEEKSEQGNDEKIKKLKSEKDVIIREVRNRFKKEIENSSQAILEIKLLLNHSKYKIF